MIGHAVSNVMPVVAATGRLSSSDPNLRRIIGYGLRNPFTFAFEPVRGAAVEVFSSAGFHKSLSKKQAAE